MPQFLEISDFIAMLTASGLGALIGLEREVHGKPAGLRTNMLVCLGSAVLLIIAGDLSDSYQTAVPRVAANIVTGVGFLGAGVVIQDRGGVHGLTTAATIWLVACIGIACGAGYYYLAGAGTFIALAVLWVLHPFTVWLRKKTKKLRENYNVMFDESKDGD